jgi:hypothetical protein
MCVYIWVCVWCGVDVCVLIRGWETVSTTQIEYGKHTGEGIIAWISIPLTQWRIEHNGAVSAFGSKLVYQSWLATLTFLVHFSIHSLNPFSLFFFFFFFGSLLVLYDRDVRLWDQRERERERLKHKHPPHVKKKFTSKKREMDTTPDCSRVVPHPSTKPAQCSLTSEFGWDLVHSAWYGRIRKSSLGRFLKHTPPVADHRKKILTRVSECPC